MDITFIFQSSEEFIKNFMGLVLPEVSEIEQSAVQLPSLGAPADFDWRSKSNVLTPIKYQGGCGSCWGKPFVSLNSLSKLTSTKHLLFSLISAFATQATLEAAYNIKKGSLTANFSEQQLVDCDTKSGGCNGGSPSTGKLYFKIPHST